MERKICPIFVLLQNGRKYEKCLQDKCEWWIDHHSQNCCAIKELANLKYLDALGFKDTGLR